MVGLAWVPKLIQILGIERHVCPTASFQFDKVLSFIHKVFSVVSLLIVIRSEPDRVHARAGSWCVYCGLSVYFKDVCASKDTFVAVV